MSIAPTTEFDPSTTAFVRHQSLRLSRHPALRHESADDLNQSLVLHLLRRRSQFDPARASFPTFAAIVTQRHLATLLNHARAACRDRRREAYVESAALAGRDPELSRLANRLDVRAAVDQLDPSLCSVARELMLKAPPEVARSNGWTRGQMRQRLKQLRERFEELGVRP
jgi:hypothetical protein